MPGASSKCPVGAPPPAVHVRQWAGRSCWLPRFLGLAASNVNAPASPASGSCFGILLGRLQAQHRGGVAAAKLSLRGGVEMQDVALVLEPSRRRAGSGGNSLRERRERRVHDPRVSGVARAPIVQELTDLPDYKRQVRSAK